ncbi:gp171 [Bacillus phage W.Ph.]|uniref:Gp171 n=1 Tax=Bacillus phage W.Ph. TaxID=764595 RepID=G9B1S2_9CAUD|nr:gp171 [Bacillus phage W.Ph.]ADH03317.1 gp171 [Bacillus phage W.Ph.]
MTRAYIVDNNVSFFIRKIYSYGDVFTYNNKDYQVLYIDGDTMFITCISHIHQGRIKKVSKSVVQIRYV